MASKKHPLEIFKKHGSFKTNHGDGGQGNAGPKRMKAFGGGPEKPSTPRSGGGGPGAVRHTPGDRRFSFSLNGVLWLAVGVLTISIGMYFLGYYKILERGSNPQLKGSTPFETDLSAGGRMQDHEKTGFMSDSGGEGVRFYGVQVGTWDAAKVEIAQMANQWLRDQGYDSKIHPLNRRSKYCIIVGSFSEKEDPRLAELVESLREVKDYPSGPASPFKDARIVSYQVQ